MGLRPRHKVTQWRRAIRAAVIAVSHERRWQAAGRTGDAHRLSGPKALVVKAGNTEAVEGDGHQVTASLRWDDGHQR
jgi:hypothetical protein